MTDKPNKQPNQPAIPDLTSAYLSGDSSALRKSIHDRVVTQVQTFVNDPGKIQGKDIPSSK